MRPRWTAVVWLGDRGGRVGKGEGQMEGRHRDDVRQKRCEDEKGGGVGGQIQTKVKTRFIVSSLGLIKKLFSNFGASDS